MDSFLNNNPGKRENNSTPFNSETIFNLEHYNSPLSMDCQKRTKNIET